MLSSFKDGCVRLSGFLCPYPTQQGEINRGGNFQKSEDKLMLRSWGKRQGGYLLLFTRKKCVLLRNFFHPPQVKTMFLTSRRQ